MVNRATAGFWEGQLIAKYVDSKVVQIMPQQLLKKHPSFVDRAADLPAKLDYRHSALDGVNPKRGICGIKAINSNPLKQVRQGSVIQVQDLETGELKTVILGTMILFYRIAQMLVETINVARCHGAETVELHGTQPRTVC